MWSRALLQVCSWEVFIYNYSCVPFGLHLIQHKASTEHSNSTHMHPYLKLNVTGEATQGSRII